jgi:Myristoyl-CoA:protein N-myristoyltransferase, N-terminal domain
MVELRTYDGDFEEVHQLIKASWSEEYRIRHNQPVMDYSSVEFLRWNLNRPNIDPDFIMAAYSNGKLASFFSAIPLTLKYNDQILKGSLASFLTAHVDFRGKKFGKILIKDLGFKHLIEEGYDLGYAIVDAGHRSINMIKYISRHYKLKLINFHKFTYLAKPLDKKKVSQLADLPLYQRLSLPIITTKSKKMNIDSYQFDPDNDTPIIHKMIREASPPDALCVDWTQDELLYNLKSNLSNTFYLNLGDKKAFINYFNINILSAKSSKVAYKSTVIDYVCFNNMAIKEKRKFVRDFCAFEKQNGSCMIVIPTLPLFDLKPFYFNLFFPSGRFHYIVGVDITKKLKEPVKIGYLLVR